MMKVRISLVIWQRVYGKKVLITISKSFMGEDVCLVGMVPLGMETFNSSLSWHKEPL